jgi:proteasome lid subunit RPN8/RPN11
MNSASSLTLTAEMHERVRHHLFPGDELEAAAVLVCARAPGPRLRLLVCNVVLVPHDQCVREPNQLKWPGSAIEDAIDLAEKEGLIIILLHSHPGGFFDFSGYDNRSDCVTMPCLFAAFGSLHGSAIMVPDGAILARVYTPDMKTQQLELVAVPGHNLLWWWSDRKFLVRPMAFTGETREELARLTACVFGVSGTGSIVAEQLARLGFGRVVLIDFDLVEKKNLNRILNSTIDDAEYNRAKVKVFDRAITSYRGPNVAIPIHASILERNAVLAASQADVLFSCVDTHDARQMADMISSAFLQPLFDVGVTIPTRSSADGGRAIADVCARVDYVRPGGPTLGDRGVYTQASLRAEYLRRTAPDEYRNELAQGYIKGAVDEAPSVITLNMRAAADLVMEFLARAYPFRHDPNIGFARRELSIAAKEEEILSEGQFPTSNNYLLARGGREPLLNLPRLRL